MHTGTRFSMRSGAVAALGALLLTGCGTPILRANFDTNTLGTHPPPELPGDPVGDSFYLSSPSSGSAVVVAAPAGLSGRSLRYQHTAPQSYSRFLGFGGKEVSASSLQYWAVWSAIPQLTPNVPLDVWMGNGHFESFGTIRLLNNQVLVATDIAARGIDVERPGHEPEIVVAQRRRPVHMADLAVVSAADHAPGNRAAGQKGSVDHGVHLCVASSAKASSAKTCAGQEGAAGGHVGQAGTRIARVALLLHRDAACIADLP